MTILDRAGSSRTNFLHSYGLKERGIRDLGVIEKGGMGLSLYAGRGAGIQVRNRTIERRIILGLCRAPIPRRLGCKTGGMILGGQDARPTLGNIQGGRVGRGWV